MPLVQVSIASGRTREQKDDLARQLTRTVCDSLGAPVESVRALITEVPPEDWFAGGTSLAQWRKGG
jgi:4-oxalocrotonate tautomerase